MIMITYMRREVGAHLGRLAPQQSLQGTDSGRVKSLSASWSITMIHDHDDGDEEGGILSLDQDTKVSKVIFRCKEKWFLQMLQTLYRLSRGQKICENLNIQFIKKSQ